MTFLHGTLLAAGLAAIALPILIHLLMRRRRRPVPWAAMRFVIEAYRRTRRRLIVERWLLLALRCLAVAALAVVIGRPIVGALSAMGSSERGRTVYLVIDNSIASGVLDAQGRSALSRHLARAKALVSALRDGDRVGIVLAGVPAQGLLMPASPNLQSAAALLDTATGTDARADLPGSLRAVAEAVTEARRRDALSDAPERTHAVLLCDLRSGSADTNAPLPKLPAGVSLLAAAPTDSDAPRGANIALAALAPQESVLSSGSGSRPTLVLVRLERSGPGVDRAATSTINLAMLELPRGSPANTGNAPGAEHPARALPGATSQGQVRWSPGQREALATLALPMPPVWSAGAAALVAGIDGDALTADNTLRVPIELRETIRVGLLGSGRAGSGKAGSPESLRADEWATLALRPRESAGIEIATLEPGSLDAAALDGLDAVFVADPARLSERDWTRLAQWARGQLSSAGGGLLIVSPSADQLVHTWPDAMKAALNLPWTIAREARTIARDERAAGRLVPTAGASARAADRVDLLAPLRGELAELARPVTVDRVLPVASPGDSGTPLLWLADGTPWLWTAPLTNGEAGSATTDNAHSAPRQTAPVPDTTRATTNTRDAAPGGIRHGAIIYLASALELAWTDLPVKPLMVPLMHELVRQGVGAARPVSSVLAGGRAALPGQSVRLRAIDLGEAASHGDDAATITVDASGLTGVPLRHAAVFEALDSRGGRRGVLTVNPDHAGSRLDQTDPGTLVSWLSGSLPSGQMAWLGDEAGAAPGGADTVSITRLLAAQSHGRASGPEWMLLVLGLLLAELWLARRMGPTGNPMSLPGGAQGVARA